MTVSQNKFDKAIWTIVSRIEIGQVMSYGEVSRAAGYPRHARMVSKAMSRSVVSLPWHRVVKSDRRLAFKVGSMQYVKQQDLLQKEGVRFSDGKAVQARPAEAKDLDELIWGSTLD
jgi:methylated-DNA-protein-cysteine methyltransferase-like protein